MWVTSMILTSQQRRAVEIVGLPQDWPDWPVLPMVRGDPNHDPDLGVLIDLFHDRGVVGYSSTVFICNLFRVPKRLTTILKLPKEVYDLPEEVILAGWRPDCE